MNTITMLAIGLIIILFGLFLIWVVFKIPNNAMKKYKVACQSKIPSDLNDRHTNITCNTVVLATTEQSACYLARIEFNVILGDEFMWDNIKATQKFW